MGVTAQEAAISAMVNWRASYMRRAFPISSGVILGFRPPLRAAGAGGGEPGLSAFTDEGGLVLGHQGEHPEHDGAVRGGGVDQPVAQRPDPDPAGLQGGDDVDEVAQVAVEPVDPPDDQGVARAQIGEAGRPLRPVGLRAAGPVGVDLQAVLGGERVTAGPDRLAGHPIPLGNQLKATRKTTKTPAKTGAFVV